MPLPIHSVLQPLAVMTHPLVVSVEAAGRISGEGPQRDPRFKVSWR